ncbi:amino acid ABC transporter substrate-binding protein [Pseudoalteromonas rubra]|uniref:Amino acid ABC transporter substrate-binding protein n=1 Tax=Pseudoalteromonas rubra TaxID=43658 RepID=A0A5S3X400_9GAMM|nr:amino acid ABC transporter substrate-binding protein [Pseudoalteromonas rubra]
MAITKRPRSVNKQARVIGIRLYLRVWCFLVLGGVFYGSQVHAQQSCASEVKIGVVADWPPLTAVDERGAYGLDVEIARKVFAELNICPRFLRLPTSARSLDQLGKGTVDVLLMVSYVQERAELGVFSAPYRWEKMRLFSLRQPRMAIDLKALLRLGYRIGLSIGSYYGEELKNLAESPSFGHLLVGISGSTQRVEMLAKQRVDFIVEDEILGRFMARKLGIKNVYIWDYPVHNNQVHFLLRKGLFDAVQLARFNGVIERLRPGIDQLVERYTHHNVPR